MSEGVEFALRAILIGGGATVVIDVWALVLGVLGVRSLSMSLLGRWIGHLPRGQWIHQSIAAATPVRGESLLGWSAHYAIGTTFAALLLALYGLGWARSPTFIPALATGVITVGAPLFILQPGMGAGVASSKTPSPIFNCAKSLVTHTVFGVGLFLAALGTAWLVPLVE